MPIGVRRKEKETTGSLLRRFTRKIQQSGLLIHVRKAMFHQRPKSKRKVRESALRREQLKKARERLIKEGLLQEGQMIPKELVKKILKKK